MDFFLHILFMTTISVPTVLAYNFIFGKGKIFHFGPMALSLAAAYGTFVTLRFTENMLLSLFVGLLLTIMVALFFAWLSLRLEPDGLGVMSIAVHLAALAVVLNWITVTRGALGIPRVLRFSFLESQGSMAIAAGLLAVAWFLIFWLLNRGPVGRQLGALAESEWNAKALGINRARVHIIVFLLSACAALSTNVLLSQYLRLLHPSDFAFLYVPSFIMMVVAGGPGNVGGVLVAIVFLTLLREGIRFLPLSPDVLGPLRLFLFGVILFAAVWWRRDTLFPAKRTV